jgi:uncharacterized glyoxalase superfamily protein PhnB
MYDTTHGYPSVVPCLLYDDIPAAVRWIVGTLGFREMVRASMPDGWTGHSELERDRFVLLLGRRGGGLADTASLTQVFVDDVDLSCRLAVSRGGTVLDGPRDQPWGVRQAAVADPQGQRWLLAARVGDTDPSDWYGEVFPPVLG